jgi:hypothetical protein
MVVCSRAQGLTRSTGPATMASAYAAMSRSTARPADINRHQRQALGFVYRCLGRPELAGADFEEGERDADNTPVPGPH